MVRLFLVLYPPWLRRKYGEEMEAFLLARLERARAVGGWRAAASVWRTALNDLMVSVVRELTDRRLRKPREGERKPAMGSLVQDLRYAARRLVRTPLFTLGALAIIALAIGANTTVFTIVNGALLVAPPFQSPERVVYIYQDSDDGEPNSTSYPAFLDMAEMGDVFQSVAATSPDQVTMESDDERLPLAIEFASSHLMEVMGNAPFRGRWFDESMDHVGAGNYAVVSYYAWENRFGSDPDIVGRVLRLNGEPVTIIGVGPKGYNGLGALLVSDLWLSISSVGINGEFRIANLDRREDHWYQIMARLAEGVSVTQAQEAMDGLAGRLARDFPELNEGRNITVFPSSQVRMHPSGDRELYSVAGILMAVVILVLILAASNLGGLLMVRGVGRIPEVAVRRALGAPPARVASLFLGEAFLLSVTGGLLGVWLAHWLLGFGNLIPIPSPVGGEMDLAMDGRVLLFSSALMVATGVFFGWAPALHSNATDLSVALREDRRTSSGGRGLTLFRNLMVAVQVAVSVVLVVGAGVMMQSLRSYLGVDTGVDEDRLASAFVDFTQAGISQEEQGLYTNQVSERLAALPGVERVAVSTGLPLNVTWSTTTVVEDYDPPAGTGSVELNFSLVSPDYFQTMGIDLLEGRGYGPEDVGNSSGIVVVNEALARFWGEGSALGRRIRPQSAPDSWRSVVGVVSNASVHSLSESPTPMLYYLMGDAGTSAPYFLIRTTGDPSAILPSVRAELQAISPRLVSAVLSTFEDHIAEAMATPRISAGVLALFSVLALLLASVGIYTIVSFSVAGRMPEIGIRVALGAQRGRVVRMVVAEVLATVVVGLVVGAVLVAAISPRVQGVMYGAHVLSLGTLLPALAVLGGTVALAAYLPARRAAAADPVDALRAQ